MQSWIIVVPLFSAIIFKPAAPSLLDPDKRIPKHLSFKIREKDSNYADANPINNQGNSYEVKYETSFS